jgi:hypothetical protein
MFVRNAAPVALVSLTSLLHLTGPRLTLWVTLTDDTGDALTLSIPVTNTTAVLPEAGRALRGELRRRALAGRRVFLPPRDGGPQAHRALQRRPLSALGGVLVPELQLSDAPVEPGPVRRRLRHDRT